MKHRHPRMCARARQRRLVLVVLASLGVADAAAASDSNANSDGVPPTKSYDEPIAADPICPDCAPCVNSWQVRLDSLAPDRGQASRTESLELPPPLPIETKRRDVPSMVTGIVMTGLGSVTLAVAGGLAAGSYGGGPDYLTATVVTFGVGGGILAVGLPLMLYGRKEIPVNDDDTLELTMSHRGASVTGSF